MPSPIIEAAERNRRELLTREAATTNRLIQAYQALYTTLDPKIQQLQRDIELLALRNELSINKVRQLNVYTSLKQQINDQITRYGGFVDTEIRLNTTATINTAFEHSQRLTQSYFQFNKAALQAFAITWDNLPTDAVENLLGFLRDDSPLHTNLIRDLGRVSTDIFEQNLIEGISLGYNSTKIANAINSSLGQPLSWAINSVRTSALYTYREATRANYLNNSEIVSGWTWYAALDGRTCLSCWAQHGKQHTLEETLNDHHQGRCSPIPNIYPKFGITSPNIPLGEDLFNALPSSVQVERMGTAKYNAYRAGEFRFSDLSEVYQNSTYGEMIKEASLVGLLGNRASQYYLR